MTPTSMPLSEIKAMVISEQTQPILSTTDEAMMACACLNSFRGLTIKTRD